MNTREGEHRKGRRRHTPEQIARRLAEGDELLTKGATLAEAARAFGITETTWYRWKQTYGGLQGPELKRRKERKAANRCLTKLVADLSLDIDVLQGAGRGKLVTPEQQAGCTASASPAASGPLERTSVPAGWPRSTQRRVSTKRSASLDEAIIEVLRAFALANPRQGYRTAYRAVSEAGYQVNPKSVARLWHEAGLRVSSWRTRRRQPRPGGAHGCPPTYPGERDLGLGRPGRRDERAEGAEGAERGGRLHQGVAGVCGRTLDRRPRRASRPWTVSSPSGEAQACRVDNGPEFAAGSVAHSPTQLGVTSRSTDPGSPWRQRGA
jgi:putative transposase